MTAYDGSAQLLRVVQDVAERLAMSNSLEEVAASVTSVVRTAVGATACTVSELTADGAALVALGSTGMSAQTEEMLQHPVPLTTPSPAAHAIETGRPVLFESLVERDREYPQFAGWPTDQQAWCVFPLVTRTQTRGILAFGWSDARHYSDDDLAFIQAVVHQCAVALDRARLLETERRERHTLELLAEGTRLMISSLTPKDVVDRLVSIAVPSLAEWCGAFSPDGSTLRLVALASTGVESSDDLLPLSPRIDLTGDSAIARCYNTGETIVVPDVPAEAFEHLSGRAAELVQATPIRSGVCVPIVASDETIGVLMLAFTDKRDYRDSLQFAAEGLAARAGIALANLRRLEQERHTALVLTQALLPRAAPHIPGYEFSARYLPAGDPVAGDWYDVMPVGDQFLLGVGDVGGHGIDAAAAMAELRNAARGVAVRLGDPPEVIAALAGLASQSDSGDVFATAIYGTLDPPAGRFGWAAAGHLPPIVFDGDKASIEQRLQSPPLGAPVTGLAPLHEIDLPPGGGVILITDGVVERRHGTVLSEALVNLAHAVAERGRLSADAIADMIVDEFCADREDDCCVVVLRRRPAS